MRITKIKIKNLFGIKELELDGSDVEITGTNGVGKSSVIDAIRYALTNKSDRDYIIRDGETEGEIIIETDTGVVLNRKKRTTQADFKSVKEGRNIVTSPESFLQSLFSELQINPVEFTMMSKKDQNKIILDLITFDWDLSWIREKFGEIPEDVDYDQNILQVLYDIQADNGHYFQTRQAINRDIKTKNAQIQGYGEALPAGFNAAYWEAYNLSAKYKDLTDAEHHNGVIARAQAFKDSYDGKMRGLEADCEIAIANHRKATNAERTTIMSEIAKRQAEIKALEDKLAGLDSTLADKEAVERSNYETKVAQLQRDIGVAEEYMSKTPIDTKPIKEEIALAEKMRALLPDYKRMVALQSEVDMLEAESAELTKKIEIARNLPGEILASATIPVEGLTVKDGIPLINGMPVSNLSEGEQLDLCVDVALSKKSGLQLILIDGIEKLSESNRNRVYQKCKDYSIQFIATRTTDDGELQVTTL